VIRIILGLLVKEPVVRRKDILEVVKLGWESPLLLLLRVAIKHSVLIILLVAIVFVRIFWKKGVFESIFPQDVFPIVHVGKIIENTLFLGRFLEYFHHFNA
jgi:hypothetical protein